MAARSSRKGNVADRSWDIDEIRALIDVLTERDVAEFEMEKNGLRIHIKRGRIVPEQAAVTPVTPPVPGVAANPVAPIAAGTPAASPELVPGGSGAEPTASELTEDLYVIKSPIVGTFYSASAPSAPSFVNVGDVVEIGQVLCIIEAMKLMNEIESEIAGEIARAYVENGQPVEYGQPLFAIRPSHKR